VIKYCRRLIAIYQRPVIAIALLIIQERLIKMLSHKHATGIVSLSGSSNSYLSLYLNFH
jgi:hypothetical protein